MVQIVIKYIIAYSLLISSTIVNLFLLYVHWNTALNIHIESYKVVYAILCYAFTLGKISLRLDMYISIYIIIILEYVFKKYHYVREDVLGFEIFYKYCTVSPQRWLYMFINNRILTYFWVMYMNICVHI